MTTMVRMIPHVYTRRILMRGVLFWILVHATLIVFMLVMHRLVVTGRQLLESNALVTFIAVAAVGWAEMEVRRERIFISNLGVSPSSLVLLPAAVALILDIMLSAVR